MDKETLENMSLLELLVLKRDVSYVLNKKTNAEINNDSILLPDIYKSFHANFGNEDVLYKMMVSKDGKIFGIDDFDDSCMVDRSIIFGRVNYSLITSLFKMKVTKSKYILYTGRFNVDPEFGIFDYHSNGSQNWKKFNYDIDDKLFIYNFNQISDDEVLHKSIIDENIYGIEDEILNSFNSVSSKGQSLRHILSIFNS